MTKQSISIIGIGGAKCTQIQTARYVIGILMKIWNILCECPIYKELRVPYQNDVRILSFPNCLIKLNSERIETVQSYFINSEITSIYYKWIVQTTLHRLCHFKQIVLYIFICSVVSILLYIMPWYYFLLCYCIIHICCVILYLVLTTYSTRRYLSCNCLW